MKKLIVLLTLVFMVAVFTSFFTGSVFAGSIELCPEAKTGMVTIEFFGKFTEKSTKVVQKGLKEKELMFLAIPEGGTGGAIWIGPEFAGTFYIISNNLAGERGVINYHYGDADTLYEVCAYKVITFYAGEMGVAVKLYPK